MIYYKTREEIELIRESSLLVSKTLAEVAKAIRPGISTLELDKIAEAFIRDHKGIPAFKGFEGFPNSLCVSVNHQVVHGIPTQKGLEEGAIVSVDCGVLMNGFYGDSAYTFPVGEVKQEVLKLLEVTKECLKRGVEKAVSGLRVGDIGWAVEEYAEQNGYSCVRELVGHGIGRDLHEKPEVPNYGKRGTGLKLQDGLVIAIEPMINMGKRAVVQEEDGWTIATKDRMPSAHFEHTLAVGKGKADVLTTFRFIEDALKIN